MKRYLVTGAAGFIGSAIAKQLIEEGHEVWTIDNLSTGFRERIPERVILVEGDCQDPDVFTRLGRTEFDTILHFAGQSSGEISFDDPVYDLRTNVESTLRLINYGLENKCHRFMYASSMSVYGESQNGPTSENSPTRTLSFYGVGKLASEHYMRIYQTKGLKPTVLRFFSVYGPNQNMKNLRQGMVSIYLAQLLRDDKVIVKGSPERFRDFIFIKDVVHCTVRILEDKQSYGGIYNVGTGIKTTVKELLDTMMKISRINKQIIFADGTPGDQKGIFADTALITEQFGFRCQYNLEAGLTEMIEWARNSNW